MGFVATRGQLPSQASNTSNIRPGALQATLLASLYTLITPNASAVTNMADRLRQLATSTKWAAVSRVTCLSVECRNRFEASHFRQPYQNSNTLFDEHLDVFPVKLSDRNHDAFLMHLCNFISLPFEIKCSTAKIRLPLHFTSCHRPNRCVDRSSHLSFVFLSLFSGLERASAFGREGSLSRSKGELDGPEQQRSSSLMRASLKSLLS
jgi:hypothetical protein